MLDHESFGELSALAATGDLSIEEFRQLQEHLHGYPLCRDTYRDFHSILQQGLPALAPPPRQRWGGAGYGLKRRFLERARKEGISIDPPHGPRREFWAIFAPAATAAGLLLAAFAGYSWRAYRYDVQPKQYTDVRADTQAIAVLSSRVAELEQRLTSAALAAAVPPAPASATLPTPALPAAPQPAPAMPPALDATRLRSSATSEPAIPPIRASTTASPTNRLRTVCRVKPSVSPTVVSSKQFEVLLGDHAVTSRHDLTD